MALPFASALVAALLAVASAQDPASHDDRWTLCDPGFPVQVRVAPFEDPLWLAAANRSAEVLHVSSVVLDVELDLPAHVRTEDVTVFLALFDAETGSSSPVVHADAQLAGAPKYRVAVGTEKAGKPIVLRVYVEATTPIGGEKRRAFYARTLDISPSDAVYLECEARDADSDERPRTALYPPATIPPELCRGFTMDGRVPVRKWYIDDQTDKEKSYGEYSFETIEAAVRKVEARMRFYYGATDDFLYAAIAKHPLAGKHVLIMGSTYPWYEAMCLAFDAASCTTLDYNEVKYHHPRLQTFTVDEYRVSATARRHFDVIFSISSFEHDGLGRYGDPLNPNADLEAMLMLKQYVKPECATAEEATKVFLAVPVGPDALVWNAQRIYGPLRLPLLLSEWQIVDTFGFAQSDFTAPFTIGHQPVFVLQAPEPCASTSTRQQDEL